MHHEHWRTCNSSSQRLYHLPVLLLFFFLLQGQAYPLYFLPSFQGTLLHNNGRHIYLSPLTPATYAHTYSLLTHPATTISSYTEYPSATCAPSSHAGHCTPLPAEGAISKLQKHYNVTTLPYDWRLPSSQLVPILINTLSHVPKGGILLAHGTACRLATITNVKNIKLACLSPLSPELAKDAISKGEGLLTLGDAHRYKHAGDARVSKDFRMMEHELGLVSRRRLLPEMNGPWDSKESFAAPQEARVELVAKLDSVSEYGDGGVLGVDTCSSICIQGSDVGNGCDGFRGRVLEVEIGFFDVVGLVEAAVKGIEGLEIYE